MNRTTFAFAAAAALWVGTARAQTSAAEPVAQPSSPAPSVQTTPPASAPAVVNAPTQQPVTQTVYMPQLPSAAELMNAAAAQGFTVERIVQTSGQIIAFYRNANGQATTVAYQSLPPSAAPVAAPATSAPARVVVVSPPPQTVVYETVPRVIYYQDYPRYYYPPVYYPPVSFSFGLGYRSYHGGGHFHRHR